MSDAADSGIEQSRTRSVAAMQQVIFNILVWILYPVWLLAGLSDVLCHRATHIAATSGVRESVLHVLQISTIGLATLLVLFMQVNVLTAWLLGGLVLTHSVLSFVDVAYTDKRRYISPIEQHVHCYLEVVPWMALLCVLLLSWPLPDAAQGLQLKRPLPSTTQILAILLPAAVVAVLPVLLELLHTWRSAGSRERSNYAM